MRTMRSVAGVAFVIALGAVTGPVSAHAQDVPRSAGGARGGAPATPQQRAELERRFRENFAAEVKKRLQATDEQMTRIIEVNQRLDAQRRQLFQEERAARISLRSELAAPEDRVNQQRVAELLETLTRLQRSRLELIEREQRELSAFLTPVQRARYQGFVDALQRRMDDMDGRGGARGRGGDANRGGPPGAGARSGKGPPPTTPPATTPPPR